MDSIHMGSLGQKLPFSKKKLPKKVIFSYILDYVIIVVLIVVFTIIDKIPGFMQPFALQNYTLQYPYAVHERVSVLALCVLVVFVPAVIIALYTMVIDGLFSHQPPSAPTGKRRILTGRYRMKDRLWELNCGILGLALSVGAAFTITGALKNAIGKPRPDLISRCNPRPGALDPVPFGLSNYTICLTPLDTYAMKDGFRSFPSGHSSVSFAGLFYLSIYLAAKLHVLDSKGEVWKTFIILVPTLAAALISGTRIMDARHHPFDVLSGAALGMLVAWGSYRQYFPPVSEAWRKGRAYPIRSWGREPQPPNVVERTDEGIEPLRPIKPRPDEEAAGTDYGSTTAVGSEENGGNVFRQQIHESQRRRQEAHRAPPSSTYTVDPTDRAPSSTYTATLPATNPYALSSGSRRQRRDEHYGYSSSEEESELEELELQPQYTLSNPSGRDVYDPYSNGQTDTSYHPSRMTSVRAPGANVPTVPEGLEQDTTSVRTPPPPEPPTHGGENDGLRRLDLVETYAR
ncbi:hypothetical protein W97_01750 [Coniosporium apollinis CBS 100218]|uniref:Phosphatidic acid phosphatase type 2/haloperoxidase domain-containing protein n=1 Tax=Coniosporium apollinis (strain CBS 100218) TaxID=1168221 RepID=R7YKT8_CONA1|nr:uncharacterized protein W97_01750 [Coniosporium apollinis CBS 100218]EON62527.1 hypothetical protein W97_01750 [Coniosporium apollinis CBS 100218]